MHKKIPIVFHLSGFLFINSNLASQLSTINSQPKLFLEKFHQVQIVFLIYTVAAHIFSKRKIGAEII